VRANSEAGAFGEGRAFGPVGGGRVEVLDVLRGIAILGILAANLESFRTPEVWNGYEEAFSAPERAYFFLVDFLASGKFITALSFLFGLGFALQFRRAREAGRPGRPFLLRRILALGLFGLLHALFVWSGDILLFYAFFGLLLLLFVGLRPALLVASSCGLLGLFGLLGLLLAYASAANGASPVTLPYPPVGLGASAEAAFASGSFAEMTAQRAREYLGVLPIALLLSGPQVFSMMLLGAAVAGAGWLRDGVERGRWAGRAALFGLAVGVPLNLVYALPLGSGDAPYLLGLTAWLVGAPIMALGWMGLVAWLHGRSPGEPAFGRLAAVGRMALTNYLVQSLIMTTFFYWLGFYGRTSVGTALVLMAGVWALELLWSRPWLSRFSYGPFEWLWRRLSYGRRPGKGAGGRAQ